MWKPSFITQLLQGLHARGGRPRPRGTRLALEWLEDRVVPSGGGASSFPPVPGGAQVGFPTTSAQETFEWYFINVLRQNPQAALNFLKSLYQQGQSPNAPLYDQLIWQLGQQPGFGGASWLTANQQWLTQWMAQNTADGIPSTRAPLVMSSFMVQQTEALAQFFIDHSVYGHTPDLLTAFPGADGAPIRNEHFSDQFNYPGGYVYAGAYAEDIGSGPSGVSLKMDTNWRSTVMGWSDIANFMLDWGNPVSASDPYGFGHLGNLLSRDPADGYLARRDITGQAPFNQIGVGVVPLFDATVNATDIHDGGIARALDQFTVSHQLIYRQGNPYITGIVFADQSIRDDAGNIVAPADGYYEPGEGLYAQLTAVNSVTGAKYQTLELADQGYALQVPPGQYQLNISVIPVFSGVGAGDVPLFAIGDPVPLAPSQVTVGNVNVWKPVMLGQSLGLALTDSSGLSAVTDDGMNDGTMNTATPLGNATQANPLNGTSPVLTISSPTDVDWFTFGLTGRATNQDSFSIYFDNSRGDLDLGLYDAQGKLLRSSTTTSNVETINLGGLGSGVYYLKVYGYHGATNFYSAQYALAPTAGNPIFNQPNPGPFTIAEGQDLNLDLSATDPDGGGLTYTLTSTPATNATINLTGGQFTWEPPPGSAGQTYTFTAVADNYQRTSQVSFKVTVVSGAPNIGSADATPDTVSDTGADVLTLTARNVTTGVGQIAYVEFWQDLDGNGILDPNKDRFLTQVDTYSGNHDYSWSGGLLGVSPGTTDVLARAIRFSYANIFYSPTAVVPVLITHTPPVPPVAVPNGSEIQVMPPNGGTQPAASVFTDFSGNIYVIWNTQNANGPYAAMRTYNAQGQLLSTTALTSGYSYTVLSAALVDNTHFDALLQDSSGHVRMGQFTTSGAFLLQTTPIATYARRASFAVDGNGYITVVWDQGGYLSERVYAELIGPNLVAQGSAMQVDDGAAAAARDPVVARLPGGNSVVVWSEFPGTIARRFINSSGQLVGGEVTIATQTGNDLPSEIATNYNGEWIVSWTGVTATGAYAGAFARRFSADGTPLDAQPIPVNTAVNAQDYYPHVVLDDGGWFAITWAAYAEDPGDPSYDTGTYAQLFDNAAHKVGPQFLVPNTTAGSQNPAGIALSENHTLAIVWNSFNTTNDNDTPYLRTYQVNFPPVLTTGFMPLITLYGVPLAFTASATDADYPAQTLTYSLQGKVPAGAKIDPAKGTFSWTPTAAQAGTVYDFFVQVQDNGTPARSDIQPLHIDVRKANDAPTLVAGAAGPISCTSRNVVTVPFQVHDADGDALTVSATALASVTVGTKATTVAVPATVAGSAVQLDLSGLPVSDVLSRLVVTLSAADWHNTTRKSLTIVANNLAPVMPSDTSQKLQHDSGALTLPLQATDPDGHPLTYTAKVYAVAASAPFTGPAATFSFNAAASTWSILPAAGFVGSFSVRLTASDGVNKASTSFPVHVLNRPSTLLVSDVASAPSAGSVQIALQASNPDNDPQTFTASAVAFNPAYQLRQQLKLMTPAGGYATGSHGADEKNLTSASGQAYFIVPNGSVYRWGGALVTSTLVGQLDPSVYADPTLLTKAHAVTATPVQTAVAGSSLTVTPPGGFTGYIRVTAGVSDGVSHNTKSFTLRVGDLAPTFPPIGAQTMTVSGGPKTIALAASDPDGAPVTYSAKLVNPGFDLEQELALRAPTSGHPTNLHGWGEKYLQGKNGRLYFILPTGQFYLWTGSISSSRLLTVLDPSYYADVTRITQAVDPTLAAATVAIDAAAHTLTIDPHGFTGRLYVQVAASDGFWSTVQTIALTVTAS